MQNLADRTAISEAVLALKQGELVAFPTETVYGLGADAQNLKALEKLFALKGRPTNHPVIVHLFCFEQIESWCKVLPEEAQVLAKEFWPGPLTMILPRSNKALDLVTGGQNSVGIRIPSHPVARELLQLFGDGVAAPSANKFGRLSPTSVEHVRADLGNEVRVILDGGACQVGIESTIVDLRNNRPQILRPGMIGADRIAQVLGLQSLPDWDGCADQLRVSGGLPSHYAPKTPLKLASPDHITRLINYTPDSSQCKEGIAVLSFQSAPSRSVDCVRLWLEASADPIEYARALYRDLRTLDSYGADYIFVETLPQTNAWSAIRDRLSRAANES